MSFGSEKRLLLGLMAALAPLPLPFNGILEWSFVLSYWMAVAVFLYRAQQGSEDWLPIWALNLIGLVYLPVVYLDFTRFWGGQVLRPLLHLAGFALVVKLFALRTEKEKWHVLIGIFFLFLASMGTSVHPSIVLYLAAFLVLTIVTLTRFATYHYLSAFGRSASEIEDAPLRRFVIVGGLLTILVGAALFPVLPRVGTPYLVGGQGGGEQRGPSSGFSDVMTLDGIGRIRTNSEVAMRLRYETPPPMGHELRYKGASYDRFEGTGWRRSPRLGERLSANAFDVFPLGEGVPTGWVQVWVEPLGVRSLFVPVGAMALDVEANTLVLDEGGAVFLPRRVVTGLEYRVALGKGAESAALPPAESEGALDASGISPRISELAARIMGTGSPAERVRRLERHLISEYGYTLDLLGRGGENPIESFLFEERRGHCELFASSMVLMLRSQGIPARLVTGFLGGEPSPLEDYFIVRQSNAHAWVEAYVAGTGWRVYEPTPPSGRPVAGAGGMWFKALQAYDYLVFRWDRYILTFGASDQLTLFGSLREIWSDFKGFLFGDEERSALDTGLARPKEPGSDRLRSTPGERFRLPQVWWATLLVSALVVFWWAWRRSPDFNATRAYRLMRRRARRRGLEIPSSMGPEEVAARVKSSWPAAAPPVDDIVASYLQESFGGRALEVTETRRLRERLKDASESMREAA